MRSINTFMALALMFGCSNAFAKKTPADCLYPSEFEEQAEDVLNVAANMPSEGCANASKLSGICVDVYQKFSAPSSSPFEYKYEMKVHEAACVKETDSEKVKKKKIQNMWAQLEEKHLKCDQSNFDVQYGSILKYSLKMDNYDFLTLAVEEWGVNLNAIDKNDGRTLLDYVQKEIDRTQGTKYEGPLRDYYKFLRKHGAKLKSELW